MPSRASSIFQIGVNALLLNDLKIHLRLHLESDILLQTLFLHHNKGPIPEVLSLKVQSSALGGHLYFDKGFSL